MSRSARGTTDTASPPARTGAPVASSADRAGAGRAPTVDLKPLRPEHRDRVREIVQATAAFRTSEVEVALEVFEAAFRPGQADYHLVGAFGADGSLLGYACYGPTPGAVDTWDLYWIVVHPEAHGRGVGRCLWEHVEARLREHGARLCVIETSSRSDYGPTHRFYATCGMTAVARVPDYYDVGDDLVIYVKRVRRPAA